MNSFVILALIVCIPVGFWVSWIVNEGNKPLFRFLAVSGVAAILLAAIVGMIAYGSMQFEMRDRELISGQITNKNRVNDKYVRTYQCMCTSDSKGNQTCQTCYEDRYTVTWTAYSTLGNYTIKHLDSGWKKVWKTPDPDRYTQIKIGDPVAADHSYKNYKLAVPVEYLYNDNLGASPELIAKIPNYPSTYDFYHVNRVMSLDTTMDAGTNIRFNHAIANELKTLGPSKEVNIILVTGATDENLVYAVREKWKGGKKNDVIVVLGIGENSTIENANVLTWDKNELFKIRLQDEILEHGILNDDVLKVVFSNVQKHYERPKMRDYKDVAIYAQPPMWGLVLIFILVIGAPGIAQIVIQFNQRRNDRFKSRFNRF